MSKSSARDVPDDPFERRDWLTTVIPMAMGHSEDLAMAVVRYMEVTRVAVDVSFGDATDADLHAAAVKGLEDLRYMADCMPLRRRLTSLIAALEEGEKVKGESAGEAGDDAVADASVAPANDNDAASMMEEVRRKLLLDIADDDAAE